MTESIIDMRTVMLKIIFYIFSWPEVVPLPWLSYFLKGFGFNYLSKHSTDYITHFETFFTYNRLNKWHVYIFTSEVVHFCSRVLRFWIELKFHVYNVSFSLIMSINILNLVTIRQPGKAIYFLLYFIRPLKVFTRKLQCISSFILIDWISTVPKWVLFQISLQLIQIIVNLMDRNLNFLFNEFFVGVVLYNIMASFLSGIWCGSICGYALTMVKISPLAQYPRRDWFRRWQIEFRRVFRN